MTSRIQKIGMEHLTLEALHRAARAGRKKVNISQQELESIHAHVHAGTYKPAALTFIKERKNGRPQYTPCRRDMVMQRVVADLLERSFHSVFNELDCSYNRLKRGAKSALLAISQSQGRYLVKFDLRHAFRSVDRNSLMETLREHIHDRRLLKLIRRFVFQHAFGLAEGVPLSPVLMNIYLHHTLDTWVMNRSDVEQYCRYADDAVAAFHDEQSAALFMQQLEEYLGARLNTEKTVMVDITKKAVRFLGMNLRRNITGLRVTIPAERLEVKMKQWKKYLRDGGELSRLVSGIRGYYLIPSTEEQIEITVMALKQYTYRMKNIRGSVFGRGTGMRNAASEAAGAAIR